MLWRINPPEINNKAKVRSISNSLPVSGKDVFLSVPVVAEVLTEVAEGTAVAVVAGNDVVVEDDADDVGDEPGDDTAGVPLTAFDATESPTALTALIVIE